MPINLNPDEIDELEKSGGGGALRQKLEEAIAENRSLRRENSTLKAGTLLQDKGFDLVKPEDLADVAEKDLEVKAEELQKQRSEEQRDLVRSLLSRQGFEGDELEAAVDGMISPAADDQTAQTFERMSAAASAPGLPDPSKPGVPAGASGRETMEVYFARQEAKRRK